MCICNKHSELLLLLLPAQVTFATCDDEEYVSSVIKPLLGKLVRLKVTQEGVTLVEATGAGDAAAAKAIVRTVESGQGPAEASGSSPAGVCTFVVLCEYCYVGSGWKTGFGFPPAGRLCVVHTVPAACCTGDILHKLKSQNAIT